METSNWKWFQISDLFKLEKCKCSHADFLLEDWNEINYVWAKKDDNWVMRRVKIDENLVTKGNCIVFIWDGQGSVWYSLYQPSDFIWSTTLTAWFNKYLNSLTGLFLVHLLDQERFRYSYGRKYWWKVVANSKIKLPSTLEGYPDWGWIEKYVKDNLVTLLPPTAQEIFSENFKPHSLSSKVLTLETSNWKWFSYENIFDIQKGQRLTVADMQIGEFNYVASWSVNNWIVARVPEYTHEGGCITFACYGSIGEVFYHEDPIWASDNVNVLIFKNYHPNKYVGLFITCLLDKEKYRFSYGLTAKMQRLKNLKIKLPVTTSWEPDWQWMEDYIKWLPYSSSI